MSEIRVNLSLLDAGMAEELAHVLDLDTHLYQVACERVAEFMQLRNLDPCLQPLSVADYSAKTRGLGTKYGNL